MSRNDQLVDETKQAQNEENDRLKRLEKKTERLTKIVESQSQKLYQSIDDSEVILDYDSKQNCAISVHPEIVKNLKEHQIAGVKFMYDCCYGSVDSIDKHHGSGCILAHCMGLGKTLQLIALLHTLIRYPQLKTKKILVICPKSTIMNWADEIQTWLRSVKVKLKVLHFPDPSDINKKLQILREWHSFKADPEGRAGCMLIGYEAFRSLVFYTERPKQEMPQVELDRIKRLVDEYLLKPGADLVVCDEGHVIKNRKSTTSRAVNKISSRRRIILTGTPIQNNLKEYYSMVDFIKPSFLGTEKEFANFYENPIKEGQHTDSNDIQIQLMKERSYVLNGKLSNFVQRRDAALLKSFLPEKLEYVLFIPMTELQNNLYQYFLENNPLQEEYCGMSLIQDYTFLRKIWTHPKVLENAWKNAVAKRRGVTPARVRNLHSDDEPDDVLLDSNEEPDDVLENQVGDKSMENDWWRRFTTSQDLRSLLSSNKFRILFEILKLCEQNKEKCLIFSAFVVVLDVVEYFMQQINKKDSCEDGADLGLENLFGPWQKNLHYYRLDGKTSKVLRHSMIQRFNDPDNERVKCFLISSKAGGVGINLVGANRVVLLDALWNPSDVEQNISRVYRFGQQKKCYIYRLVAMGTMEEKIYTRSVTKQAMSYRVVDGKQIDRHYSLVELADLYTLTKPDPAAQPTPVRPVDNILASLLRNFKSLVFKYHEHDSLLENNSAEDLNEQEKRDIWNAYEKESFQLIRSVNGFVHNLPKEDGDKMSIGRSCKCDLILTGDDRINRMSCEIVKENNQYLVKAIGTVYVNGNLCEDLLALKIGDVITFVADDIGDHRFVVGCGNENEYGKCDVDVRGSFGATQAEKSRRPVVKNKRLRNISVPCAASRFRRNDANYLGRVNVAGGLVCWYCGITEFRMFNMNVHLKVKHEEDYQREKQRKPDYVITYEQENETVKYEMSEFQCYYLSGNNYGWTLDRIYEGRTPNNWETESFRRATELLETRIMSEVRLGLQHCLGCGKMMNNWTGGKYDNLLLYAKAKLGDLFDKLKFGSSEKVHYEDGIVYVIWNGKKGDEEMGYVGESLQLGLARLFKKRVDRKFCRYFLDQKYVQYCIIARTNIIFTIPAIPELFRILSNFSLSL